MTIPQHLTSDALRFGKPYLKSNRHGVVISMRGWRSTECEPCPCRSPCATCSDVVHVCIVVSDIDVGGIYTESNVAAMTSEGTRWDVPYELGIDQSMSSLVSSLPIGTSIPAVARGAIHIQHPLGAIAMNRLSAGDSCSMGRGSVESVAFCSSALRWRRAFQVSARVYHGSDGPALVSAINDEDFPGCNVRTSTSGNSRSNGSYGVRSAVRALGSSRLAHARVASKPLTRIGYP